MSELKIFMRETNGLHWADTSTDGGKTVSRAVVGFEDSARAEAHGRSELLRAEAEAGSFLAVFKTLAVGIPAFILVWVFAPYLFADLAVFAQIAPAVLILATLSASFIAFGRAKARARKEIAVISVSVRD